MPQACTICTHAERRAIDKELVAGHLANRRIATQRTLSEASVRRHAATHLPAHLVKAAEADDVRHALDVVQQLKAINGASLAILSDARRTGNADTALKAIDRIQRQIELQAKLLGELDERPQVNVLVAPEWLQVRATLLEALRAYPEARTTVSERLLPLEATNGHR